MKNFPRILLVDDDTILLRSLRRVLEDEDFQIETASCASEAMLELMKERFDGIICDYKMVGVNGKELLKKVREEYPSMFRIMLTGQLESSNSLMVLERDKLDCILQKPCDDVRLVNEINRMMECRRGLGKRLMSLFSN
jgi:DNA-binding NtrC family response regulator